MEKLPKQIFAPPSKRWKIYVVTVSLFCSAFFLTTCFFSHFLRDHDKFWDLSSPPWYIARWSCRWSWAKKIRFEKNTWFRLGDFWGGRCLEMPRLCVLRENKKGPNDQSSKGVGCWLLVFWGRGSGKKLNQKIFLPNGVREKEKKRKHSYKNKDI